MKLRNLLLLMMSLLLAFGLLTGCGLQSAGEEEITHSSVQSKGGEITVTIPKRAGIPLRVEDRFVENMEKHSFISRKQKEEYENAVRSLFSDLSNLDSLCSSSTPIKVF